MVKKKRPKKEQTRYLVVQESVAGGPRTQFDTPEAAYEEAEGLLGGQLRYKNYRPPRRLLVVQIVGGVEFTQSTRRLTVAQIGDREIEIVGLAPRYEGFGDLDD